MKVRITFDLGDDARRGIACHYGEDGLASHERCKDYIRSNMEADFEDLASVGGLSPAGETPMNKYTFKQVTDEADYEGCPKCGRMIYAGFADASFHPCMNDPEFRRALAEHSPSPTTQRHDPNSA